MEPNQLLELTRLWNCLECEAVWHDPWFTEEFSEALYGYSCGQHYYGWYSLARWVEGHENSYLSSRTAVWSVFKEHLGTGISYAELQCPLSGLMFAELDWCGRERNRSLAVARLQELHRAYGEALLAQRPTAKIIRQARCSPTGPPPFLERRTLLTADSHFCWRRSCVYRGAHCHSFAQDFLFDRIVPLSAAETAAERFDAIGAFSILDHFPDPLGIMDRLLTLGRRVILEMHAPGWTDLQHLYGFGDGFIRMIVEGGVHIRDITGPARSHGVTDPPVASRILVLSRDDDLRWLDGTG